MKSAIANTCKDISVSKGSNKKKGYFNVSARCYSSKGYYKMSKIYNVQDVKNLCADSEGNLSFNCKKK